MGSNPCTCHTASSAVPAQPSTPAPCLPTGAVGREALELLYGKGEQDGREANDRISVLLNCCSWSPTEVRTDVQTHRHTDTLAPPQGRSLVSPGWRGGPSLRPHGLSRLSGHETLFLFSGTIRGSARRSLPITSSPQKQHSPGPRPVGSVGSWRVCTRGSSRKQSSLSVPPDCKGLSQCPVWRSHCPL